MRRHRNVKIVATLGPASSDYKMIRALHEAGADVFRLNMSHGTHSEITERHAIIRQIEADTGSNICILADLQGPKLRVGVFANEDGEMLAQVVYAIRNEMALTMMDILIRRTGIGTLGLPASGVLEKVAGIAAVELGWNTAKMDQEMEKVTEIL